jgi:hypothetical protein
VTSSRATHSSEVSGPSHVSGFGWSLDSVSLFSGMRPFGVSFLFAGHDKDFGYQLYQSDPSGNYGGWKATAIGANSSSAQSILKQDYKEDMDLHAALLLAIKVLAKSMDSTQLTPDKRKSAPSRASCSLTVLSVQLNLPRSPTMGTSWSARRRCRLYWTRRAPPLKINITRGLSSHFSQAAVTASKSDE